MKLYKIIESFLFLLYFTQFISITALSSKSSSFSGFGKKPIQKAIDSQVNCPCGSSKPFGDCCEPMLQGNSLAMTPEQLVRSRFSAYCTVNVSYICKTTHPSHNEYVSLDADKTSKRKTWERNIRQFAEKYTFTSLVFINCSDYSDGNDVATVKFRVKFKERENIKSNTVDQEFVEISSFKRVVDDINHVSEWLYSAGDIVA